MDLRIITLNVRGLGSPNKRRAIFNYYRSRCDVLCLQETHSTADCEAPWQNEWKGKIYFSHCSSSAKGTAILINCRTNIQIESFDRDERGRFLICNAAYESMKITLCSLYAPNEDNPQFFLNLLSRVSDAIDSLILLGDFNLVIDMSVDSVNTLSNHNKSVEVLQQFMNETLLIDIWRVRNPELRLLLLQKKTV